MTIFIVSVLVVLLVAGAAFAGFKYLPSSKKKQNIEATQKESKENFRYR